MDSRTINSIAQQIRHQFPDVDGNRPSVRSQAAAKNASSTGTYLLTFKGTAKGSGGPSFARTVRVVADENGRILKVTTSR
jgi:hypothetical protein